MSTVKFLMNLFLLMIFISLAVVTNVDGIPVKKKPLNVARRTTPITTSTKVLPKSSRATKKPNTRDPRFLGKFSFVAGLNLPNPPTMSPVHRNDILNKQRVPTQYVTTYNFPPSSWGPFAAAVYEPPPIPSFFEDPLGYLAAILNPYNWFNDSFSTTTVPTTLTTVEPDKNQDEVYVLVEDSDNEIPNEERMNNIESKMGHQNIEKRKYVTKQIPIELSTTIRDYTSVTYDGESDTDLTAEETTIKPIEKIRITQNFEDDSRQLFGRRTKTTEPPTRHTELVTRHTESYTRSTIPKRETSITENITPIQKPNTTSSSNGTIGASTSTTNTTAQTPHPLNNVTYPIYNHGYYYGGYPQNVSHIELTTLKIPHIDQRIQSLNDVNQYLQPYQPNYHDFDQPPNQEAFDFFRRSEQLPPLPNNYYDRNSKFTFNNMDDNGLNGFKPSFPMHFK